MTQMQPPGPKAADCLHGRGETPTGLIETPLFQAEVTTWRAILTSGRR